MSNRTLWLSYIEQLHERSVHLRTRQMSAGLKSRRLWHTNEELWADLHCVWPDSWCLQSIYPIKDVSHHIAPTNRLAYWNVEIWHTVCYLEPWTATISRRPNSLWNTLAMIIRTEQNCSKRSELTLGDYNRLIDWLYILCKIESYCSWTVIRLYIINQSNKPEWDGVTVK